MFGGNRCANVYSCPSSTFLVEFLVQLGVTLNIIQWKAASVSPSSAVLASFEMFSPKFLMEDDQANLPMGKKKKKRVCCLNKMKFIVWTACCGAGGVCGVG